nr:Uncharacterised protein [Ipomoea batatas]
MFFSSATKAFVVFSIPLVIKTGFAPAATTLTPSAIRPCARTTDVVVPSPAKSLVLAAACLTSLAPMFSTGSSSSTSLATVTPSLTIFGAPYLLSRTTFLPLGPSVTPTRSERVKNNTWSFLIADPSLLKYNSLAAAVIWQGRVLRRTTFFLLPKELEDIEARDDNLFEEIASLLSFMQLLGAANEPAEDMPAKVEAICT